MHLVHMKTHFFLFAIASASLLCTQEIEEPQKFLKLSSPTNQKSSPDDTVPFLFCKEPFLVLLFSRTFSGGLKQRFFKEPSKRFKEQEKGSLLNKKDHITGDLFGSLENLHRGLLDRTT